MNSTDVAHALLDRLGSVDGVRLVLAGPAGIGKTSAAIAIGAIVPDTVHVEHDRLKRSVWPCPCSVAYFDLRDCFGPHMVPGSLVLDTGGGTIFRPGKDNEGRLAQLLDFKQEHHLAIALLVAPYAVVKERHLRFPGSSEAHFDDYWSEWESLELPFWRRATDLELDVS